jgi:hypothetical protein
MNAVPDYSYGKSTVVVKFSNSKYTDDSFSIVKDPVSKEILKNCGPRTHNFEVDREYFFIVNRNNISQCTWRKHQTRIEVIEPEFSGCGGGCGTNFVDNVFPLDSNASILIENNHILYV